MSTITLRNTKGSALTHTEVDNNFSNLNNDKYESGDSPSFAAVTATTVDIGLWQIKLSTNDLLFEYNGTAVFKITTTGATIALDDVTAFGTP